MKASCRKKYDVFKVRYFNSEHTCPVRDRMPTKVQATIGFISGVTAPKLVNHKRIHTPKVIIDVIREFYGVQISYQQAWRVKERALEMIRGKPSDGYRQMPRYIYMLNTMYPNSYIRMHKTEEDEFMYLFIALRPLMRGFDYCRPIVVVDGAHLGGAYKGTFLSASTLDGAGCILPLPLAYGVVDTENDYSWTWFFKQFKNAFGEREEMSVVSYRNESIMKSVSIVFPNVPHYACIWHLWKNVCSNFKRSKNTLSDLFYSMAKAYRKDDFDKLMAKVDKIDHRVKEYLEDAGEITSYTKDTLGRKFEEVLIINASKSSKMKVVPSSEFIFSVYEAGRRYIVCLERKVCSCGRFQLDEIPCAHAIDVLKDKNVTDMHPYCSDYYKPDALAKTYEIPMVPMPDREDWSVPDNLVAETVFPPGYKRLDGRPRKRRRKKCR